MELTFPALISFCPRKVLIRKIVKFVVIALKYINSSNLTFFGSDCVKRDEILYKRGCLRFRNLLPFLVTTSHENLAYPQKFSHHKKPYIIPRNHTKSPTLFCGILANTLSYCIIYSKTSIIICANKKIINKLKRAWKLLNSLFYSWVEKRNYLSFWVTKFICLSIC